MGKTLTQLIAVSRQKSDTENSSFVSDAEITTYLQEGIRALYDLIISVDSSYYEKVQNFTLASTAPGAVVALASDFYKVRLLEIFPDTDRATQVYPLNALERNRGRWGYTLDGNSLTIWPWQNAGQGPWRLHYVADTVLPVNPGDQLDVTLDKFNAYPPIYAACCILRKRQQGDRADELIGAQTGGPGTLNYEERRVAAMASARTGAPEQAPILWVPSGRRRSRYDDDEVA